MSNTPKIRAGFFASAGGSTIEHLLMKIRNYELNIKPLCVILDRECEAYDRCIAAGIPKKHVLLLDRKKIPNNQWTPRVLKELNDRGVNHIGLHGFDSLLPVEICEAFQGRSINQHPTEPQVGGYGMIGIRTIAARLIIARETKQNMVVRPVAQRVDPEFDQGKVIAYGIVTIEKNDTPISLYNRVKQTEYDVQTRAWRSFAEGCVKEYELEPVTDNVELLAQAMKFAKLLYPI